MKIYRTKEFYLENKNLTNLELANKAGCSESTINKAKRDLGLTFALLKDPSWDYKKLLEITNESMYWAGYLLADGCFFNEQNRKIGISLSSSILDKEHLEKFIKWLNTTNKLYLTKDNCCSISVYSKRYVPEIMSFWNFSYRKTYTPYEIPKDVLNSKLFKYFIVGLIDGDGSVVTTGNTYKITITQHISQISFLNIINNFLDNRNHKLYISDRDNTANLTIQLPLIKNNIKQWYVELESLPLKRKLTKMI